MSERRPALHGVSPALDPDRGCPPTGGCERGSYLAFILRELSSIFVAWFVVYLLLLVRAVEPGSVRLPGVPGLVRQARASCC